MQLCDDGIGAIFGGGDKVVGDYNADVNDDNVKVIKKHFVILSFEIN
jgi:hypothetical protein